MLAIRDVHVDRAAYVIDTGEVAQRLASALNYAAQGRPRQLTLRTWLIGAYLAIEHRGSFKSTTIHEVLTSAISLDKQHELGVRQRTANGKTRLITKSHVDYIARWIPKRLACTPAAAEAFKLDIDEPEMQRRRSQLQHALDGLLDGSLVTRDGSWYALDGSGTWTWGKSKYRVKDERDVRAQEAVVDLAAAAGDRARDEDAGPDGEPLHDAPTPIAPDDASAGGATTTAAAPARAPDKGQLSRKRTANYDPDAAFGSKTSKSGERESYYGYVIDAAIRVTAPGKPKQPVVVEQMVISPASTDVVAPTLAMLDRLLQTPGGVTDIVVDRHYSYKRTERWADELRRRGISQHFDLRNSNEQGFRDVNGMRLAAGWMHCPATPDDLGRIERPSPGASKEAQERFAWLIDQRRSWAMDRHERVNEKGRSRWTCPAVAGVRGCPLRPGTVETAKQNGLPIVATPPNVATAPKCCTNDSGIVSDNTDVTRKHQQPYYWGSDEWNAAYDLRTYVEGFFGSLKNPDTEGVRRGFTKFVGLPMTALGLTLAAAVCNVRHQRRFWEDHPDRPEHPLLTPEPAFHGWRELTRYELAEHDTAAPPTSPAAAA